MRIFVFSVFLIFLGSQISAQNKLYPFQDNRLPFDKRVDDLLQRLTVEEKVLLMQDVSRPIERLGIKQYNWWNEALHGVARAGLATVFPQPIGMAASFDRDALFNVFNAVSDEARAKHNYHLSQGSYGRYEGLTMWTPTINIFRDPRWGRGIETYGEDPYLTAVMGVQAVKGLQGPSNGKYDKLHACAKHFAVHSGPEWNRHSFDAANIKQRDLYETYLPAFEALVKEAKVQEVMCAYNRFEGDPCCGSDRLLQQILRKKWGFEGIVVADCGAIADFFKENAHKTHPDAASASAAAVYSGTDLDCGSSYKALTEAVKKGLIEEKDIDVSVRRLLMARFRLGEMDDQSLVPWSKISYNVVASKAHNQIALDMARKSITLLQNKNNILPLKSGGLKIAVMGPNAQDSVMQWGNYNGTPANTITILEGIKAALGPKDKLIYEQACGLVEQTLMRSAFNECSFTGKQGFRATYWNNKDRNGAPATNMQMSNPFALCTSGATVFAPKVELTDFSASYEGVFKPSKSGEVVMEFYMNGLLSLWVDGTEVKSAKTNHGSRKQTYNMKVQQGKNYDIKFYFAHNNGDAQLNFDIGYKEEANINKSIKNIAGADLVVFVGGISPSLEGEEMGVKLPGFRGGDRTDIQLPTIQRQFVKALKEAGKRVIFINCSGSPIGLADEMANSEAIVQAWYPGQAGGQAVADVLFGKYNPSGRLPITFYRDTTQLPDFENYDMAGRTYRYMQDKPLFPFGYGLSYTQFQYGNPILNQQVITNGQTIQLTVPVTNTGKRSGDEVVQVYLRKKGDATGPVKTLRDFRRLSFNAGQTQQVVFKITPKQLEWWNEQSKAMQVQSGDYELLVGKSSADEDLKMVTFTIR
ncbi:glycoside hydrolase family 3 domain protein [Pseudopedobacter saltans DSM 12145]|uniref:Glycoside hydrolase family 3 domain protein n=1 Tax=Pseudopedobacter saltans (strain ATCC 51119 / DSM 12145 / JCM 21818 / CCUG 39354 / LMG 10337 / NBRC 100064 / NCIMB 13643) TaxID=762903 RepID=F0S5X5_PSESL|nr:xylan 1,4-beta-xylosidase [Pseudopedobacter saltans]ADY51046.1 glycoside hydrolase family 3 domain protein [Pseudopedobacter saltans DSM 12145]